jgi:hypothetical protein
MTNYDFSRSLLGLILPEEETVREYLTYAQGDLPRLTTEMERLAAVLAKSLADLALSLRNPGCAQRHIPSA